MTTCSGYINLKIITTRSGYINLKIVTTHSGFIGKDGSTHNALEDLSLLSALPNLTVLVPADNIELVQILKCAFNMEGPFYIRLLRNYFPKIYDKNSTFSIGKLDILKEGNDVCLIGTGYGSILAIQ